MYDVLPKGFFPYVEVSACYVEIEGSLLLLQCSQEKEEHGAWGVPAGKIEKGETPHAAACRELWEETGILTEEMDRILSIGTLYIHKPNIQYVYHMFKVGLDSKPSIVLSKEHSNYKWATREEMSQMPLMLGAYECLNKYFSCRG